MKKVGAPRRWISFVRGSKGSRGGECIKYCLYAEDRSLKFACSPPPVNFAKVSGRDEERAGEKTDTDTLRILRTLWCLPLAPMQRQGNNVRLNCGTRSLFKH